MLASIGGAVLSGFLQIPGLNYLLSVVTIFVNIALAVVVYSMT